LFKKFVAIFGRQRDDYRLDFDQARSIAAEAVKEAGVNQRLQMAMKTMNEGRKSGIVSASGMGHAWLVLIDDETGKAGPLTERHGR
jgi:hypothetical protein